MPKSSRVLTSEAAALFRVLCDAYESASHVAERVERVLTAGCKATHARIAAATVIAEPAGTTPMRVIAAVEGGQWTTNDRTTLKNYYAQDDHEEDLVAKGIADLMRVKSPRLGKPMLREEVVPDRAWYGSDHVNDFRRTSDMDSCIYGGTPTDASGRFCGLSFHRAWGERAFSEKERQLITLLQEGVAPLLSSYVQSFQSAAAVSRLPPRQRQLLDAFAAGDSEQEAARRLGLSAKTIHFYAQLLYSRLGVRSRGELLAFLLRLGYKTTTTPPGGSHRPTARH